MTVERLSVALFAVCGFLLMSYGGAVVAAPVSLPLMYLAVRRQPTTAFRWAGGIIAGLTAVEVVWVLVYLAAGEETPWIGLVPLVAGTGVLAAFLRLRLRPAAPAGPRPATTPPRRPAGGGSGRATGSARPSPARRRGSAGGRRRRGR
jgi:apolipoprotein N-acyltransferase